MKTTKNFPLIIGVTIPVLMIVVTAAAIYVPGYFAEPPTVNFVYVTGDEYYACEWDYRIISGRLTRIARPSPTSPKDPTSPECAPVFYLHDVTTNESRQMTYEEAATLSLNPSNISPDGYEVVRGSGGGGFPFFSDGNNYNDVFLRGHNWSKKMNITSTGQPYEYYNFRFLGWVLP